VEAQVISLYFRRGSVFWRLALDSEQQRRSLRLLEHHLLAYLLRCARAQAGLDLAEAATQWGHTSERLEAFEAGTDPPDWWDVRSLLAVYGLSFPAFSDEYDGRLAVASAPLPNLSLQ
jgi:hypothetical protein